MSKMLSENDKKKLSLVKGNLQVIQRHMSGNVDYLEETMDLIDKLLEESE